VPKPGNKSMIIRVDGRPTPRLLAPIGTRPHHPRRQQILG